MGMARLKELEEEMHKCFRCNLCKMIPLPVVRNPEFMDGCPATLEYGFHSYSGSGKQIMALSLVQGRISVDRKLAEVTYACTTCGLCDVSCKFIMDAERHLVNMALREHVVDEGHGLPIHEETIQTWRTHGHPQGAKRDRCDHWASGLGLKQLPGEKAQVLIFAGCRSWDDPGSALVAKKLARLLVHAGLDVGILADAEPSCGLFAYWTGYRDVFTTIASSSATLLDSLGVRTIVTASGSCLGCFRSKYPEYARGLSTEVVHASEMLWRLVEQKRLRLPARIRRHVTYHDPCYLGRQSEPPPDWQGESRLTHGCMTYHVPPKPIRRGCDGVYDAPRNLLRSINGLDLVEMYRIREYSFCCGGGGGVPAAFPDLATSAGLNRIHEAHAVGAEVLVTACHECRIQLARTPTPGPGDGLPIVDLVDLVYEAANIPE